MSAGAHVTPEMPTKRVAAVCVLTDEAASKTNYKTGISFCIINPEFTYLP